MNRKMQTLSILALLAIPIWMVATLVVRFS
jgi:hypothetical protein